MNIKEAIVKRRSIKHFDPEHVMTEAQVHELMSHVILSPTAFNIQHWRFIRVIDKDKRQKIRDASWGQSQVTEGSLLLVLCADLKCLGEKTSALLARRATRCTRRFITCYRQLLY